MGEELAVRIHHLNCISTCPLGGKLMDGRKGGSVRAKLACHCLLIELPDQLILVDTGFGLHDVANPRGRLSRFFLALMEPEFRAELTAIRQIERLGFSPRDVRHIILTHLDFDHAGGLDDFPWAAVHMLADERDTAAARKTMLDRMRYRPQQWSTRDNWRVYSHGVGEPWFGFDAVRGLDGLPPEVLMVPLLGHTLGHAGVAIQTNENWLLQAGDAYFFHGELDAARRRCPPGLRFYQWMMEKDREARLWNLGRLRDLRRSQDASNLTIVCGHDPHEFERLAGRSIEDVPQPLPTSEVRPRPAPGGDSRSNKTISG